LEKAPADVTTTKISNQNLPIDIGANASAEDAGEDLEDGAVQVNNVVYAFRLQSTSFDKKSYLAYLKGMSKSGQGFAI
jgi:hypothetical protein